MNKNISKNDKNILFFKNLVLPLQQKSIKNLKTWKRK